MSNAADLGLGILSGVRILDMTSVIMGPYATQMLGDHGAEVIFVEHPAGKGTRELGASSFVELSGISVNLLRNKRSLSIDLKNSKGRAALLEVAKGCDVVITNLRPAPLQRLGLDYDDFRAVKQDIIFCQAMGFPGDTSRSNDPAYDDIIQSECGLANAYEQVTGVPQLCPTIIADKVCSLAIANAVTLAILHKLRTGSGQRIEVPMVDVLRAFVMVEHGAEAVSVAHEGTAGYRRVLNPERGPQRTSDGWIMVLPYSSDAYDILFRAGGREDLVGDPRSRGRGLMLHAEFLYAQLRPIIAKRTTAHWLEFCREAGIPVGRVEELDTILRSYPLADHPGFGRYRSVPHPIRFSATPAGLRSDAPMLGEHTETLLQTAGLSAQELRNLEAAGIIHVARTDAASCQDH